MSIRYQARIAGGIYLTVVVTGLFSLAYAPRRLLLSEISLETLDHLHAHFPLFVAQIVGVVAMSACFMMLPLALARFLRPWGPGIAWLMIVFVALSLPPTWLAVMNFVELAIAVARDADTLSGLADARAGYRHWIGVATVFWGLWLAPLGLLVLRSRALPRTLGVLLLLGSVGYLFDTVGRLYVTDYGSWPIAEWVTLPASIGELGTCAWLLIFGARAKRPATARA